jgi:hypothetical protein
VASEAVEYLSRMEDILDLYEEPSDQNRPVVCIDERPCQLIGDVVTPIPMKPGKPKKVDNEYERNGTCSVFIACEPLTGWRYVEVHKQRTKVDYAEFMDRVSEHYTDAAVIRVVQDNLNTHNAGSFYEQFDPEKARNLKNRFEFHYTPKKGSWLNMAEIELSALARQCLDRRMGDMETLESEAKAWEEKRNQQKIMIQWRFTTNHARDKLGRHYKAVRN